MAKTKSPADSQPIKAYHNMSFIDGTAARPIRMLAEYIEPRERFERRAISDTILFFGSVNLFAISLVGEYIAKIFEEVKQRPHFLRRSIVRDGEVRDAGEAVSAAGEGRPDELPR